MRELAAWIRLPEAGRPWWTLGILAGALVVVLWWEATPPGLLGKADAVGYAICHRIDGRSFHLGDRSLPLCARCTGIYLGAVLGVAAMAIAGRGRAGSLPPWPVIVVLVGFIGVMGIDGLNSYMTLFPGLPHLYEPSNTLRTVTGTLNGLALAGLVYPTFNQTVWKGWEVRRGIQNFRELGGLVLLAAGVAGMVLTENPLLLYPLALLSAAGVLLVLTMVDSMLILLILRRENRAERWRDLLLPVFLGLTVAVLQIGAVDLVRYWLTGTWAGFSL